MISKKIIVIKKKKKDDSTDKKVNKISIEIDDVKFKTDENITIIEACKNHNIEIPSLCYHKDLLPYGACRLCLVEIEINGRTNLVASCGYYVKDGLKIKTDSPRVQRIQKLLTELYIAIIPESKILQKLAFKYRIKESRYKRNITYCILCGLCVRYCNEVKFKNAIGTIGRGQEREVAWIPLTTYEKECEKCFECINICPTGVFPSNWGTARVEKNK